jgi:hypothetical protein
MDDLLILRFKYHPRIKQLKDLGYFETIRIAKGFSFKGYLKIE